MDKGEFTKDGVLQFVSLLKQCFKIAHKIEVYGFSAGAAQTQPVEIKKYAKLFNVEIKISDFDCSDKNYRYKASVKITDDFEVFALLSDELAYKMKFKRSKLFEENERLKKRLSELENKV